MNVWDFSADDTMLDWRCTVLGRLLAEGLLTGHSGLFQLSGLSSAPVGHRIALFWQRSAVADWRSAEVRIALLERMLARLRICMSRVWLSELCSCEEG